MDRLPPINHSSISAVHSATSIEGTISNDTLIKNGVNALWLLFADSSSNLGWKSSIPGLNGFGLGNPALPGALASELTAIFQQLIGSGSAPSPFMDALSDSTNPSEKQLYQGLSTYLYGTEKLASDLSDATTYYVKNGKYDIANPKNQIGKILDMLTKHSSMKEYPLTYVQGIPGFNPDNSSNFKDMMGILANELDPNDIAKNDPTAVSRFGEYITGNGDNISPNLWFLVGGNTPTGDGASDPMDMLIHGLLSTPLGGKTNDALASWAYKIHNKIFPNPTDNPEFFAAFLPGGIGSLLTTLGFYGNSLIPA